MIKRLFDIVFSLILLIFLMPVFIIISIWIVLDSRGGVFYRQIRVGRYNTDFNMLKFRTTRPGSDTRSLLTVGGNDPRITRAGKFLRRAKIDEFPQLINILAGHMSIVGPRPEVRKYVDMYNDEQLKVLNIRPGLTDYASLEYLQEDDLLAESDDPEKTYIEVMMPAKLVLNLKYIRERSMWKDIRIICRTLLGIVK